MSPAVAAGVSLAAPPSNGVHVVAASAGFTSFLLVWAAVMWGMFLRNGWGSTRIRHSTLYSTHMGLGLTGLCLAVVHGAAQAAAPVTATSLVDVVIPFQNLDSPAWGDLPRLVRMGEGVGTLSLELMVAATAATAIRRKLGHNRWHAMHMLNYAGYLLMVAHILVSGSDVGATWAWGSVVLTTICTGVTWAWTTGWGTALQQRGERTMGVARPGGTLEVEVDAAVCARFGFCEHEAPEVFRLTGDGRLTYKASVPMDAADTVVRAARVCPARAIRFGQTASEVVTPPTPVAPLSPLSPLVPSMPEAPETPARGGPVAPAVPIHGARRRART